MAYDNNLTGMLARNDRKQQPTHPDYQGSCEIDGKQFWISGWIKEGKPGGKLAGKKFFSLAFKVKDAAQASNATPADADAMESTGTQASPAGRYAAPAARPAPAQENLDEDVPF